MFSKQKHFRFENNSILVLKTLSLLFRKHFHFAKKVIQKQIDKKSHQLFWSWPMRAALR